MKNNQFKQLIQIELNRLESIAKLPVTSERSWYTNYNQNAIILKKVRPKFRLSFEYLSKAVFMFLF